MTETELLALVRAFPECAQSAHFGTTDFRVRNKIFATNPKPGVLNLNLTREQQQMLVASEPGIFSALPNRWGEKGWTTARIEVLDEATARSALTMAWGNVAPRALRQRD
jgi:hypothetical protein